METETQVLRVTLSIAGTEHCHIGNRMYVSERLVFVPPPPPPPSASSFSISIQNQSNQTGSVFDSTDVLQIHPDFETKSGGRKSLHSLI